MILIADTHVSENAGNSDAFFRLMEGVAKTGEDLIFLGDIFDLWIALPGFEGKVHQDFLDMCRDLKKDRTVGFIEGNHEFRVAQEKGDCFTWCSEAACHTDAAGILFTHGDRINRRDRFYLIFRQLIRNAVTRRLFITFPEGPRLTRKIKKMLGRKRNHKYRNYIPWEEIDRFGRECFTGGVRAVFSGHFHLEHVRMIPPDRVFCITPDWYGTGKITVFDEISGRIAFVEGRRFSTSCPACGSA